jgi:hypothetical protein
MELVDSIRWVGGPDVLDPVSQDAHNAAKLWRVAAIGIAMAFQTTKIPKG